MYCAIFQGNIYNCLERWLFYIMNNEIKIFDNKEFGEIRSVVIDGKPYFCASDIAKALGYKRPNDAILQHCRATVKHSTPISGKLQDINFIPEGDVYRLIIKSKLPTAEKFESWVMDEVLPSIRKTGSYGVHNMSNAEKIALLAQGNVELSAKVDKIENEIHDIKYEMPILPCEADEITSAVKKKGLQVLGGKDSHAYHDRSLVARVYSDIYHFLKRNFDVRSYKSIKRSQIQKAISIIENYELPYCLQIDVEAENSQIMLS